MKLPGLISMEFDERFRSEEACVNSLREVCWSEGFICPSSISRHAGNCLDMDLLIAKAQ